MRHQRLHDALRALMKLGMHSMELQLTERGALWRGAGEASRNLEGDLLHTSSKGGRQLHTSSKGRGAGRWSCSVGHRNVMASRHASVRLPNVDHKKTRTAADLCNESVPRLELPEWSGRHQSC